MNHFNQNSHELQDIPEPFRGGQYQDFNNPQINSDTIEPETQSTAHSKVTSSRFCMDDLLLILLILLLLSNYGGVCQEKSS